MLKILSKSIILLFLIIVSTSCLFKRQTDTAIEDIPDWVLRKPQSSTYYIGVSSASKIGHSPNEYIENARNNALADLASSISVNIESRSAISIIESEHSIYENFSRDIAASTSRELEDFELVDTYEDEQNYWVYYRLSRQKYQEMRERKKNNAVTNAKTKYIQAEQLFEEGQHFSALNLYADALSDISLYLGEQTPATVNNKEIDLGHHIYIKLVDFFSTLNIYHPGNEIHVKRGVSIDSEKLSFKIMDSHDRPVGNIPFRVNFSSGGLLRSTESSDTDGNLTCSIRRISSNSSIETLSVSVDMQNLSRITNDPIVRNIIRAIPAKSQTLRIIVEKPSLYVSTSEKILNSISDDKRLKSSLTGNLGRDFEIVEDKEKADFIILAEFNSKEKGTYHNEHYVDASFIISMTDASGNNIFRRRVEDSYMGSSFSDASRRAHQAIERMIERRIAREIFESIS